MKIELFLDEGEEYPQLFSVWRVNQETGRTDLTTRRNYVDDRKGWDQWRKTDDENIRLKVENSKLRELVKRYHHLVTGTDELWSWQSVYEQLRELGIEVNA